MAVALVTGAARPRSIGRATAMRLAEMGHDDACRAIARAYEEAPTHGTATADDLDAVVADLAALRRRAGAVRADVPAEAPGASAVEQATDARGTGTGAG